MNDGVETARREGRAEGVGVAHIGLDHVDLGPNDPAQPVDHALPCVGETVEDRDLVPGIDEREIGVRADIARPARQKNSLLGHACSRMWCHSTERRASSRPSPYVIEG